MTPDLRVGSTLGTSPKGGIGFAMSPRIAYLGCDLARYGPHWAVLVDDQGIVLGAPQSFRSTQVDYQRVLAWTQRQLPPETELHVILEPTGPATAPVQAFWRSKGIAVYVVIPFRVKRFRESYQSHTKTDRLDAFILAKYAQTYGDHLRPVIEATDVRYAQLRDRVKEIWRMSRDQGSLEKQAQALVDLWIPEFGASAPTLTGHQGAQVYREIFQVFEERPVWPNCSAAMQALALGVRPEEPQERAAQSMASQPSQQQLARLLARYTLLAEQKEAALEELTALYEALDPDHLVQSLIGVGPILAPFLLALRPAIEAVKNFRALKAFVGMDVATMQSNRTVATHGHMTKAGASWARWALYLAAEVGRRWDPQLAAVYHRAMMEKGKCHQQAVTEVAIHQLRRLAAVLKAQQPYEPRDLDGHPMPSGKDRRAFISQRLVVPESVRNRTRAHRPA